MKKIITVLLTFLLLAATAAGCTPTVSEPSQPDTVQSSAPSAVSSEPSQPDTASGVVYDRDKLILSYGMHMYLDEHGDLYTWGIGGGEGKSDMGQGDGVDYSNRPVKILSDVADFSGGRVILTESGDIYTFRSMLTPNWPAVPQKAAQGAVSVGSLSYITAAGEMYQYTFSSGGTFKKVADGVKSSDGRLDVLFIKTDGSLWTNGCHWNEKIGTEKIADDAVRVECGGIASYFWLFLDSKGDLYGYGDNEYGAIPTGSLGDFNDAAQSMNPIKDGVYDNIVDKPFKILSNVVDFRIYDNLCLALTDDGKLYGWGDNRSGFIPTDTYYQTTMTDEEVRQKVYVTQVTYITDGVTSLVGGDYLGVIKNSGELWSWGYCDRASFGNGYDIRLDASRKNDNTRQYCQPVKILDGVADVISESGGFVLAQLADGTHRWWGDDYIIDSDGDGEVPPQVYLPKNTYWGRSGSPARERYITRPQVFETASFHADESVFDNFWEDN